jgi:hypothetical protein
MVDQITSYRTLTPTIDADIVNQVFRDYQTGQLPGESLIDDWFQGHMPDY